MHKWQERLMKLAGDFWGISFFGPCFSSKSGEWQGQLKTRIENNFERSKRENHVYNRNLFPTTVQTHAEPSYISYKK